MGVVGYVDMLGGDLYSRCLIDSHATWRAQVSLCNNQSLLQVVVVNVRVPCLEREVPGDEPDFSCDELKQHCVQEDVTGQPDTNVD